MYTFVAASVPERLTAYEEAINEMDAWYKESIGKIKKEQEKNVDDIDFRNNLIEEIKIRDEIINTFKRGNVANFSNKDQINTLEAIGNWSVIGYNPDTPHDSYYGKLTIEEDGDVLLGNWNIISGEQHHIGIGFIHKDLLAFTFSYNEDNPEDAGVVVYEMLTNNVMRGVWTGYGANSLGYEECIKIIFSNNIKQ